MNRKNSQNLILPILILGLIAPSFLLWPVRKANAENIADTTSFGATAESIDIPSSDTINTSNSAAEDWKTKSCGKLLGDGIKELFGTETGSGNTGGNGNLDGIALDETSNELSVPVYSTSLNRKIDAINEKTTDVKKATGYLSKKGGCLDSLAKIIIKNFIQKITMGIIDWINTGYEGKPFFLEDPGSFFKNIAQDEILAFGNSINDPNLFPFGKNFMQNFIGGFRNKFATNAQYSLNNFIQRTNPGSVSADFYTNFNIGGWNAWLGMTQYPQNNPIGFSLMASNALSVNLQGTFDSRATQIKDSIRDAGGFLGDERCADPEGVTHAENSAALRGEPGARLCNRWEYVTPGKLIADKLTYSANSSERSLEVADDINSALAAIGDAALNKFISDLTTKGLKGLSGPDNTQITDLNDPSIFGPTQSVQFQSFSNPSSWLASHMDFNLKTDLTQAFIDEQRTYLDKIDQYNSELENLIKNIYQLDYCIPGPHPGWENDARRNLDLIIQTFPASFTGFSDTFLGSLMQLSEKTGAIGIALNFGYDVAEAESACGDDGAKKGSKFYKNIFYSMTGFDAFDINDDKNAALCSKQSFADLLTFVFNEHAKLMNKYYNFQVLPGVAEEASVEFKKIPGYEKIIQNNKDDIAFRKSVIQRLQTLKSKIDALDPAAADYDNSFDPSSPIVTQFARLSANFSTGDDVANMDNLYKQARDKKNYIYDVLLQGPDGCEKDLENRMQSLLWQQYNQIRPKYLKPILYSYPNRVGYVPGYTGSDETKAPGGTNTGFLDFIAWRNSTWALETIPINTILKLKDSGGGGNGNNWEKALGIY